MKEFEELLKKRDAEIKAEERRNEEQQKKRNAEIEAQEKEARKDKENFEKSIGLGILFAVIGGFLSYLVAVIAFAIIKVLWRIIFYLFIAGYYRQNDPLPPITWGTGFIVVVTIAGICLGWFGGYSGNRLTRKGN